MPRKKKNRVPRDVAEIVIERAMGMCEIMSRETGCNGQAQHLHHRKLRSQGGEHTAENLVHICGPCHAWLHAHPAIAYTNGWLVKGVKDPAKVPVRRRGGLTLLTPSGDFEATHVAPLDV